jgi:hypothetical protein
MKTKLTIVKGKGKTKKYRRQIIIKSASSDKVYTISESMKGEWSCSCPAWIYSTPRHDCKHISEIKSIRKAA